MLDTFEMLIPTTKSQRTIRIYVPEGCDQTHPCDVLFMHDAQNLFDDAMSYHEVSWRVIDGLKKAHQKVIIVGIDNAMQRLDEYSPYETHIELKDRFIKGTGGLGDIYINFIVQELMPYVQTHYPMTQNYYMAGSSMGAYISMFAAIRYPNLFKGIGCFSIASWFNEAALLKDLKAASIPLDMSFYISVGKHETSSNDIKEFPDIYINNSKNVYDLLQQKGIKKISFHLTDGYHNERQWMELFPDFITFITAKSYVY
jgi:predicted alpha/beta superfamily hydrolase